MPLRRLRSPQIAPALLENEEDADAETGFSGQGPQSAESTVLRATASTPVAPDVHEVHRPLSPSRRKTRGTLILRDMGGDGRPAATAGSLADRRQVHVNNVTLPEVAIAGPRGRDSLVQLLNIKNIASPGMPLVAYNSKPMKCRQPKDLLARSLAAGTHALLVHFVLLSDNRCRTVDLEILDQIITTGADLNCSDSYGQTALHEVARLWDATTARFLIDKGADPRAKDAYGRQPIHVAAGEDTVDVLEALLEHGVSVDSPTTDYVQTPIHHAAANDAVKAMDCLVKHDANYELCDASGRTPLQLAVDLDRTEAVNHLLSLKPPAFAGVESSDGRKALTAMVVKMPEAAATALSQFHSTSASQRTQLYWINYLEHSPVSKGEAADGGAPTAARGKALTPLDVIVQGKHYSLLTNPVVHRAISLRWKRFGCKGAVKQTLVYFLLVLIWTVVAVAVDWEKRYMYPSGQKWRFAFEALAVISFAYDVYIEVREYITSRREHDQWAAWRHRSLTRDLKACHPANPDEREYIEQEIKAVVESSPAYFEDLWNLLDWVCYLLMLSSIISHTIDVAQHSRTIARVHAAIIVATIIMLWIRLLKYLRAFRKMGPFVVMVTRITRDVLKFLFLYVIVFIPYACGFWVFFGKRAAVTTPATNTTEAATVVTFSDVSELVFHLFLATIGSGDFIGNLEKIDDVMTHLLVSTFLALMAILLLNLLIALMSDTFQRVHDNVKQNALMQQAATVISMERDLSPKEKQEFREHIASTCSPERMYFDDDSGEQEDLQKIARQTFDELVELRDTLAEKLDDDSSTANDIRAELAALRQEVHDLRSKMDSVAMAPPSNTVTANTATSGGPNRQRQSTPQYLGNTGASQSGRVVLPPLRHKNNK